MKQYMRVVTFCALTLLFFAHVVRAHALASRPGSQESHGNAPAAELGDASVTAVVSIVGPRDTVPPPVDKSEVNVSTDKTRLNVTGWTLAQNSDQGSVQLAILIDNDVRATILGQQVEDLANFITSLPNNISVGVFYAQYGSATVGVPFSLNRKLTAQKLRLSEGRGGDSPSIYLSLADLATHWQPTGTVRREVLLISSGIDVLYPGIQDPYFDSSLDQIQRAGLVVFTIYDGSSRYGSGLGGQTSQGKLIQLAEETGGQSFMEGSITPVSIAGYLSEVAMRIKNQYLLTFSIGRPGNQNGELRNIDIHLEQRDVKVSYPHRVFVSGKG